MTDHQARAADFHRLHSSGCFVMPNPWDVGSARALERMGFPALATTSAGFAWTLGRPDGRATRDEVLEQLREHHAGGEDRTILLSTHDLGEIDRFVDHVVLLHEGRVVLEGGAIDLVEEHLVATTGAPSREGCAEVLRGARRSGDQFEALVRAEDAVGLDQLTDLRRPTLQDILTFTLREVSR